MTAQSLAERAYGAAAAPLRTARSTEFDAFATITRRLRNAVAQDSFPELVAALHENRRLWTLVAMSVANKDNTLPQALRAQLFYLSEFTNLQTRKILNQEAPANILIEINTSIMRGLRNQGVTE